MPASRAQDAGIVRGIGASIQEISGDSWRITVDISDINCAMGFPIGAKCRII